MKIKLHHILPFFVLAFVITACKTTKLGGTSDCPKKEATELVDLLKAKAVSDYTYFSAKIDMDVKDSQGSKSFKTTLRMRTDSAFSGVLKVAGIIGAAYLADKDSISFTNKLKKCYSKKDFKSLKEQFGLDLNYKLLEDMILGKPFGLNTIEELYPLKADHYYVLASHDKKIMKRLEENNLTDEEVSELFIQYKIDCGTLQLSQIQINAPSLFTSVTIDYIERQEVDGYDLPKQTKIKIVNPKDSTFISMDYGSPKLNDPSNIRISIPDSYNECE
ncbi:MAG: DUF4292 domain-containing protein [Crocinitomicaceae bacterium]